MVTNTCLVSTINGSGTPPCFSKVEDTGSKILLSGRRIEFKRLKRLNRLRGSIESILCKVDSLSNSMRMSSKDLRKLDDLAFTLAPNTELVRREPRTKRFDALSLFLSYASSPR